MFLIESSGFKRIQPVSNKDSSNLEDIHDENSDTEKPEDDFEIIIAKPEKPKSKKKKNKKKKIEENEEQTKTKKKKKKSDPETNQELNNRKNKKKSKILKNEEKVEDSLDLDLENGNHDNVHEDEPPVAKDSLSAVLPKNITSKSTSVIVDPKKIFPYENQDSNLHGDDADQLITIQQAFANDDVIEEFAREKEEAAESSKGKDTDLTLPGWGEWGGPGIKVSQQKKKKFVQKAEEPAPRKDKDLDHVIINEEVNKKFVKMQVSSTQGTQIIPGVI